MCVLRSSLSPIPTWKILKNDQIKLVLSPVAHFLELLHVLPVKATSKGTAAILRCSENRHSCLTEDCKQCCFSWGGTSSKSLVGAGGRLWLTMNGVSLRTLWGEAAMVANGRFSALCSGVETLML